MTNKVTKTCLSLIISASLVSGFAYSASDNTISFQGEVTAETCSVTVNGNTTSPVVLMPTVSTTDLSASGDTAGATTFTMGLTGCTGDSTASTTVSTVFVGNNVSSTGNLTNTGTAGNVEVQLLDPQDAVIDLTDGYTASGDLTLASGETESSANYNVQYYATGVPTAGTVVASLQYAVSYQ
ncbi:fimbrial protein [Erwiniaceae bacterium L1_54_6]|jgi:major type 1 subunit fimbrin (pilin)|uniref:Type 1 fimbrial protein n=1 Tax=Pantoea cypripedii TaxID=55209 RepID=A0A6B9GF53_PANCY|nr:fimbrial protein [Pantoea cypripedii]MDF7659017.1 fimbrial protein [Erwiniaceae bacterium L1_54_6]QGY31935.1 type 1 fimbrial protein [Pantoea cypripedii]